MKLTPQTAQALTNLRGNKDFLVFWEGVTDYQAEQLQVCISSEGTHLHRAQGAVKALQNLQDWYAEAPVILDKFKGK